MNLVDGFHRSEVCGIKSLKVLRQLVAQPQRNEQYQGPGKPSNSPVLISYLQPLNAMENLNKLELNASQTVPLPV